MTQHGGMTIELFGMARALAGVPEVALEVGAPATLRSLLEALATRYPQLKGAVLDPATHEPLEPNVVLLDGRRARGLDETIDAADKPVLLFLPSGG